MATNYEKIREENILNYGKETRHLKLLGYLYSDRTHFIFEILQNAEDANAKQVLFSLYNDRLEVRHNGHFFNEDDVRGICGISEGTKVDDLTKIGKFGIGFKSVYAYTATPEIHSGDENFRIENYIRPHRINSKPVDKPWTTLFVFPFNNEETSSEIACKEIGKRLLNLNARTLLFLKKIVEIQYELPDSTDGFYLREEKKLKFARQINVIGENDGKEEEEKWLVFERSFSVPNCLGTVRVEAAFLLENDDKANKKAERIVKIKNSPLNVFFPTEKDTRLGFLIQGPYRTTPSRDNIPKDDEWNKILMKETAALVSNILFDIKKLGLLSVSFLETLPIKTNDFPGDGMFYPIFEAVKNSLKNESLLPTANNSFVSAKNAKLACQDELIKLLNSTQLQELFQHSNEEQWLDEEITQDRTPDLRSFLINQLCVEEVSLEKFLDLLTDPFLEKQADKWLANFYIFLNTQKTELWKKQDTDIRKRKILRLEDNTHVFPFKEDGKPNAYLPSSNITNFATLKKSTIVSEEARSFLRKLGLIEPDLFAEIFELILPKYLTQETVSVDHETNINDLKQIKRFLDGSYQGNKSDLLAKLKIIFGKEMSDKYLGNFTNETIEIVDRQEQGKIIQNNFCAIIGRFLRIIKAFNGLKYEYKAPYEIYIKNHQLSQYFGNNLEAWFIAEDYPVEVLSICKKLGVADKPRVTKKKQDDNGYIKITTSHGNHSRGLDGFDPDIEIKGLSNALSTPTIEKSCFIWNEIVLPNAECIRGKIEKSTKKTYEGSSIKEYTSKNFGSLLIDTKWLPSQDGKFYYPREIYIDELPESFGRNEKLVDLLGMKKNVVAKLAEEAGLGIEMLEFVRDNPEEIKKLMAKEPAAKVQSEFPSRPVNNPERRQERVEEQLENAPCKNYEHRDRSVRTTASAIEAATWLRNQYTNDDDQMVCQVCKNVMPFRKRDGKHYFEKKEVLNRNHLPKEHDAQFLALCPLCAAKYGEFITNGPPEIMDKIKDDIISTEGCDIPIELGDEKTSIRFVETHLIDLKTILGKLGNKQTAP